MNTTYCNVVGNQWLKLEHSFVIYNIFAELKYEFSKLAFLRE